jgi:hypothetical protein
MEFIIVASVAALGILFCAFAATRLWERERAQRQAPPRDELALKAALVEAEKALQIAYAREQQTPSGAAEDELMRAIGAETIAEEKAGPLEAKLKRWPYRERVPVQLRQAGRDLRDSGNVFGFMRGLRHALLPMLDRPEKNTATS